MSDSDDWENALDDQLEDKPKEEEKKEEGKFADEDAVDSDDERKQAAEEAKKKREADAAAKAQNVNKKGGKKDYEKMYAERQGKGARAAAALQSAGVKGE